MADGRWYPVAPVADVTGPPWPCVRVRGTDVRLVATTDGTVHGVGASCPHLRAPLRSAEVGTTTLACSRHYYEFRLVDGRCVHPGGDVAPLPVHPTRVVGGTVEIWMAAGGAAEAP